MTLPFGIDISKWQGSNNFAKMKANTSFVFVKATESWGYTDPTFHTNWQGLVGHNRGAYSYIWLSDDPLRQANHLIDIVTQAGANWKYDRLVLDLEKSGHGLSKAEVSRRVLVMMERIKEVTGRYPILYSRKYWVQDNMLIADPRLVNADWWLAGYRKPLPSPLYTPEATPPPALPKGVSQWLIHQTGERGNGSAVGVASHYVDTNRWNGTKQELLAYFGLADDSEPLPPEPEPPVDPPTDPEPDPPTQPKAYKATVTANVLNVRKAPQDIVVGSLKRGAEVEVLDEQDAWRKLGHQLWVSGEWLKRIANAPDPQPQPDLVPYVLWGQRDARWASDRMGASNITLGQQGCLVTAVASVMASYGIDTDPKRYNGRLSSEGGYLAPNLMYWQMPRIFWGVRLTEFEDFANGVNWQATVNSILSSNRPVLAMVDMIPGAPFNQHWVTIVGKSGNDYWITDPWTADLTKLTRYENKIHRIAGYTKP